MPRPPRLSLYRACARLAQGMATLLSEAGFPGHFRPEIGIANLRPAVCTTEVAGQLSLRIRDYERRFRREHFVLAPYRIVAEHY